MHHCAPPQHGLFSVFNSEVVMNLDDEVVEEIAAEQPDYQIERARALTELKSLKAGTPEFATPWPL
jgi:hypothetical protein